jgi:hypothetical protein
VPKVAPRMIGKVFLCDAPGVAIWESPDPVFCESCEVGPPDAAGIASATELVASVGVPVGKGVKELCILVEESVLELARLDTLTDWNVAVYCD